MRLPVPLAFAALLLLVAPAPGRVQIERLTLEEMVARCDQVVAGEVVARRAFVVDHPVDGLGLVFTELTVAGRSLVDGRDQVTRVLYHGGFPAHGEGYFASEAPREDETTPGRRVVVFATWTDNMGADVAGYAIHAGHGGLYALADGPSGDVVLGRGSGYAVRDNQRLAELDARVSLLRDVGAR